MNIVTVNNKANRAMKEAQKPVSPEKTTFFQTSNNLFDKDSAIEGKTVTSNGVEDDPTRWLSDFIPVTHPDHIFSITQGSYRIAAYTAEKEQRLYTGITDSTLIDSLGNTDNAYVRISGTIDKNDVMMNKGETLLPYEPYGGKIKPEFVDVQDVDEAKIKEDVKNDLSHNFTYKSPDIPKLTFTTVDTGFRYIKWLSSDGEIIWGAYGGEVLQSTDEWVTRTQIGTENLPQAVSGIRELSDGELLIVTVRDESASIPTKAYKTQGYDRNNPSAATFTEVLSSNNSQANINNEWGMSVYENIVILSEYGLKGLEGARNVYLSTDNGDTFTIIFDLHTVQADGKPELNIDTAHVHTAAYDPYFDRIWIACGDNPNTATYYSDDMGATWKYVEGSNEMQYTGILALPNCVLFGSDRAPNGVHVFYRGDKASKVEIKPLFLVNDADTITHVFKLPYKRDWNPETPTYFASTGASGTEGRSVIMGTVDGKKMYMLHQSDVDNTLDFSTALGPTAQGNIIGEASDSSVSGKRILKAPAPNWG